jgi:hypothetical protein
MELVKWLAVGVLAAAAFCGLRPTPAAAEDDDTYVAPSDEDGSAETLREEGQSGFDTAGSFYISEDDYDAGSGGDGTWAPDVPEPSEPEYVEDDGD